MDSGFVSRDRVEALGTGAAGESACADWICGAGVALAPREPEEVRGPLGAGEVRVLCGVAARLFSRDQSEVGPAFSEGAAGVARVVLGED